MNSTSNEEDLTFPANPEAYLFGLGKYNFWAKWE